MWRTLTEAVCVSSVLHAVCVWCVHVNWQHIQPRHSVATFLGAVLDLDDVRHRSNLAEREDAPAPVRLFAPDASRPAFSDYDLASPNLLKPRRVFSAPAALHIDAPLSPWQAEPRETVIGVKPPVIEGPLHDRAMLYLPPVPSVPAWSMFQAVDTQLVAEIHVSAEGHVTRVSPVVSSGDPVMDRILLRYLRSWIFVPEPSSAETQRSIIRLNFYLQ